jgi:hypothetical protein
MASSPAARQKSTAAARLCRQRQRDGLVRLAIWVDEVNMIETLRIAQFIGPDERDPEQSELEKLLEHVLRLWIAPPGSAYEADTQDGL